MMTPSGRILLVDDDPRFNATFRELLTSEGFAVESALSVDEALRHLDDPDWDLVLLDRKLQGRAGPDTGLDLLDEIRRRAPATKVILITAYADADSVARAFTAGAFDYLEKNAWFDTLLPFKVRNALEAARERRIAALANGRREQAIAELWAQVEAERNPQRKGKLLEDLLLVIFKSVPGFERAQTDLRSGDEQLDLVIPNESDDPFWRKEPSQFILVECKHWSGKVEPPQVDRLKQELERRHQRCRLAFLVAPGGFTTGVLTTLAANRKDAEVIVLIGRDELRALIDAGNGAARNELLKNLYQRSIVRG